jgi:hypothetical protein
MAATYRLAHISIIRSITRPIIKTLPVASALIVALAIACGGSETSTPAPTPTMDRAQDKATPDKTPNGDETPALTAAPTPTPTPIPASPSAAADTGDSSASDLEVEVILATTVLRQGEQRVAFLLATSENLIKAPEATVTSVFLGDGEAAGETRNAGFHLWPYGVRGSYSTQMTFDRPGPWRLDISVEDEGILRDAQLALEVAEEASIPEIGAVPPLARNKTLHNVAGIEELTSDATPDPDLYQLTVGEAIITGRPTVIVFATPAFCTSPTCGPQVDTVSEMKELHKEEANFIHVEIYDNPAEIQGDLSKATLTEIVHDWGMTTIPDWFNESWTFIIGPDGRIVQRFEGFATLEELEEALQQALAQG